ncbi:ParB/Srx family N-terminal domain-containing protein [Caballeronia sp. LZ065]|uniref:ParB/Srx family N-terminal domain-containing protein n=1 Tax=Caballeronia sp. LZ065 TaxID=3038571 RepID=UPI0028629AAE|nr:ParB/Srx family N-terminal domain-containing protein [Caballeronia sp. LZ065]MDR5784435.1 ParB/Srx family N-terminal domain-containing protein [Caballeronia sp. LZ065]
MQTVKIKELRPTQLTHGLREVRAKTRAYKALSGHELDVAIAEKPVPVVYGPSAVPYAIDHHHVAAALFHADVSVVPVVLVKDLSSLSAAEFWLALENERWTFPYNAKGERVSFSEMRTEIWDLQDDEFRSLAAAVESAGGYKKAGVPLEEFRWADFFRHRLPLPTSDDEFDSLAKEAAKLALTKAALGLPGYLGPAD